MKRLLLFAHGAGAPSTHPWMERWAALLSAFGAVERFDYPYMAAGRKAPDKLPALIAAHRAALSSALERHPGPVVLIGKSMGSRMGCHLAVELAKTAPVAAVVCLGYPLRSPSGQLRDEVLRALRTPTLFVQGTRDALCPLEQLEALRAELVTPNALLTVDGGDHSLELGKRALAAQRTTQTQLDAALAARIGEWLDENAPVGG